MSEVAEYVLFWSLIGSLDSAFMARQGKGSRDPDGWGERFFSAIEQEHAEWVQDMTSIYATARRLLFLHSMQRPGWEFGVGLYRRPEGFLRTVLMLMRGPTHSAN